MADITNQLYAADAVKIVGTDNNGLESNGLQVDLNNAAYVRLRDPSGTDFGTAGNPINTTQAGVSEVEIKNDSGNPIPVSGTFSDIVNTAGVEGAISVGLTPVPARVGGSNLVNRKLLTIMPVSNGRVYFGYNNTVTTTSGTQIFKNTLFGINAGPNLTVYLVADTAAQTVQITEAS